MWKFVMRDFTTFGICCPVLQQSHESLVPGMKSGRKKALLLVSSLPG